MPGTPVWPNVLSNHVLRIGIQPFFLYENMDQHYLCPVRAYARWVTLNSPDTMRGYMFRKRTKTGHVSQSTGEHMVCRVSILLEHRC
jgi:hypothetical protein